LRRTMAVPHVVYALPNTGLGWPPGEALAYLREFMRKTSRRVSGHHSR
jgi:hypothetical protein